MAGPFCCQVLGDMGADVIKVEPPGGGDQTRARDGLPHEGRGQPRRSCALNRNKRSVALNLKNDASREVFYRLVETADVAGRELPPGRRGASSGSTTRRCASVNPRLVYASISGFGQTGPYAAAAGLRPDRAGDVRGDERRPASRAASRSSAASRSATSRPGLFARYGDPVSAYVGRVSDAAAASTSTPRCSRPRSRSRSGRPPSCGRPGRSPQPIGSAHRMTAPYQALRTARRPHDRRRQQPEAVDAPSARLIGRDGPASTTSASPPTPQRMRAPPSC